MSTHRINRKTGGYDPYHNQRDKYRIINPVQYEDQVIDKSKINYLFDCPRCSSPNRSRFPMMVGHVLRCAACMSRCIIMEVVKSPTNDMDYLCGGIVIPEGVLTNSKDPTQRKDFDKLLQQWKLRRMTTPKKYFY